MAADTTRLLPDTPAEFRAWLDTLPDAEALMDGTDILERFLQSLGARRPSIAYLFYTPDVLELGIARALPDWASDVQWTVDSGFYRTVGDVKRYLDGKEPRFLTGEAVWDFERRAWVKGATE